MYGYSGSNLTWLFLEFNYRCALHKCMCLVLIWGEWLFWLLPFEGFQGIIRSKFNVFSTTATINSWVYWNGNLLFMFFTVSWFQFWLLSVITRLILEINCIVFSRMCTISNRLPYSSLGILRKELFLGFLVFWLPKPWLLLRGGSDDSKSYNLWPFRGKSYDWCELWEGFNMA